jgi:hypothetical protein
MTSINLDKRNLMLLEELGRDAKLSRSALGV